MFTIQRTNDDGAVIETVVIPPLLEAAGGAAIDAYCAADAAGRAAQLAMLGAAETARIAQQEQAWREANGAAPAAADEPVTARRRRAPSTPTAE